MVRLKRSFAFNVIDAHLAYPDGYAATLLGRWLRVPVTITLRGTEVPLSRDPARRRRIVRALQRARRVFSVWDSLKGKSIGLGAPCEKILVVGNGVDTGRFHRISRRLAREQLGLPIDVPVLISVGALVERKGFHRVMECLRLCGGPIPACATWWLGVLARKAIGVPCCINARANSVCSIA